MGGIWMDGANHSTAFNTHYGDQAEYGAPEPPTYIFNNTIVSNGYQVTGTEFGWFGLDHDGVFLNNIVAQFGAGGGGHDWLSTISNSTTGAIDVDSIRNNLFWREWDDVNFGGDWTDGSTTNDNFGWTYWTSTLGGTGVNEDPLFINNFGNEPDQGALRGTLQSNSPAINAGEDLTYLIDYLYNNWGVTVEWKDINGNPRDNTPTIGAYEYDARPDVTPPDVTGAVLLDSITLKITFSEPLDPSTAQNPNNYSINNGITVVSALLSGSVVTLTTSPHSIGTYTITVSNVKDLAGNIVSPTANSAQYERTADITPPEVTGATLLDSVTLKIMFSELLDETTAEDENNYSISNNIDIFNASLSDGKIIELIHSEIIEDIFHILGIVFWLTFFIDYYKMLKIKTNNY